jgi:hypothetical protein
MKTRYAYVLMMALAASPAYAQADVAKEAKAIKEAVKAVADAQKELHKELPKLDMVWR